MNLIDLKAIFIITQDNFNEFLTSIGSTLMIADPVYAGTYILANIMTYLVMIIFIYLIIDVLLFILKKVKKALR